MLKVAGRAGVQEAKLVFPAPACSSRPCHPSLALSQSVTPGGTTFDVILGVWLREGERTQ